MAKKPTHDTTVMTTSRIEAFSDGVFAIAITLLALQLELPPGFATSPSDQQLVDELVRMAPSYFTFILSFLVIGRYWMAHHDLFRRIKRSSRGLAGLNLLLLLTVVALPFPTEVLGEYGNLPAAAIFYALSISAVGIVMAWTWRYADQHRLLDPSVSEEEIRSARYHSWMVPAVFLLSIPVALVEVTAAEVMWTATFFIGTFTRHHRSADRK